MKITYRLVSVFLTIAVVMAPFSILLKYDISHAGWIDDWIAQRTESGPAYFEGQKRGYFTAGSFSARMSMPDDYLFTVQKPKLKSGCGGIDLFLGGFSFLNADYLVKKLQRIMTAAPAVAFTIALNTIAPEINQEMSKFSSMTDQLNKLQLDDCKAATTIATVAVDELQGKGDDVNKAVSDFSQSAGLYDLYKKFSEDVSSNGGTPTSAQNYLQGCSADIQNLFGTSGFLLDKIAAMYYTDINDFVPGIRAYVGDVAVMVDSNTGMPDIKYTPPSCGDQAFDVDSFVNGKMKIMKTTSTNPPTASCSAATDSNSNISMWVQDSMQTISDKIQNHQPFTNTDKNFINVGPVPVYSALLNAVAVDPSAGGAVAGTLQDTMARVYAYQITWDLLHKASDIVMKLRHMSQANQYGANGQSAAANCQLALLQNLLASIRSMESKGKEVLKNMGDSYMSALKQVDTVMAIADRYRSYRDIVMRDITNRFGRGAAIHALGK